MGTGVREKYNVAINSKGYMLRGAPNNPAYRRDEVPTAVSRLALSDLQYSDFSGSGTFFTAQTDWSAGIKSDKVWKDDAKFYYSTNIDAYSEPGAFKLLKQLASNNAFSEDLLCGTYAEVNSVSNLYVGTGESSDSRPKIYKFASGSWSEIAGTAYGTSQNAMSQVLGHKNKLYGLSIGVGYGTIIQNWNGSSWSDLTAAVSAVVDGGQISRTPCGCELAGTLYIACDDYANDKTFIVSTADGGSTWVKELYLQTNATITDMIGYAGKIYYLTVNGVISELRVFNPADNSDTSVQIFYNSSTPSYGMGGRLLFILRGKLIITIPGNEIYDFDGSTLKRIFVKDAAKNLIGREADFSLAYGGVLSENRIFWANLVYDGEAFFNFKKDSADLTSTFYVPLMINNSSAMYGYSDGTKNTLLADDTNYKGTLAKNFLVFSEMSPVVSIDKLLSNITIVFDALAANESIAAEYSINGMTSWTALTTMTSTTEGSNTSRTFSISNPSSSILYKKLFVRVKLASTTTTTPVVRDVIVGYKPIPDYKNRWQLRLEMSNGVKLLNNQNEQRTGSDLLGGIWNEKATKQLVNFEDIDYVECALAANMAADAVSASVTHTRGFPSHGRIRAVSGGVAEEMIYTSAESNKILGISRGQRGTTARAYSSSQVLKNDYSVYIERMQSEINFTDETKTEHIATVVLLEA